MLKRTFQHLFLLLLKHWTEGRPNLAYDWFMIVFLKTIKQSVCTFPVVQIFLTVALISNLQRTKFVLKRSWANLCGSMWNSFPNAFDRPFCTHCIYIRRIHLLSGDQSLASQPTQALVQSVNTVQIFRPKILKCARVLTCSKYRLHFWL